MKSFKKCITVVLIATLILGILPAISLADDTIPYKIVAIGDSTCNGYGMDDWGLYKKNDYRSEAVKENPKNRTYRAYMDYGFLQYGSEDAYPAQLAEYIKSEHPEYDVEYVNLGIAGARSDMFRYLIAGEFEGDYFQNDDLRTIRNIEYFFSEELGGKTLSEYYTDEIESADVITLDACLNNFTDSLLNRLTAALGDDEELKEKYRTSATEAIGTISKEAQLKLEELILKIKTRLGIVVPRNVITDAVDAITYCYTDFCVNFSQIVAKIKELNPDVKLIVTGAYQPLSKMAVSYNGYKIEIATLLQSFIDATNTYVTTIDPNRFFYSYADVPQNLSTYFEYLKSCDSVWDIYPRLVERLVDAMFFENNNAAIFLCNRARENAVKNGVTIAGTKFEQMYAPDVVACIEKVREEPDCTGAEKYFAEVFCEYMEYYLVGAKTTVLDPEGFFESMNFSAEGYILSLMKNGKTPDNLTASEKTALFSVAIWQGMRGMGAHPDLTGCTQKFEAAKKAYEEGKPAAAYSRKVIEAMKYNAVTGAIKAATDPVAKTLKNAFVKFLDKLFSGELIKKLREGKLLQSI